MADVVRITGIEVFAKHGVESWERTEPQKFLVDLTVEEDTRAAAAADDIVGTFWYEDLVNDVVAELEGQPVRMRDTLAVRIAERIIARGALNVEVTLHTTTFPSPVKTDEATITVRRKGALYDDSAGIRRVALRINSSGEQCHQIMNQCIYELGTMRGHIAGSSVPKVQQVGENAHTIDFATRTVIMYTALSPMDFAADLRHIEVRLGRKPGRRLGGRDVEITIMAFGSVNSSHPALPLPHPEALTDEQFLEGWLEIDEDARLDGELVRDIFARAHEGN